MSKRIYIKDLQAEIGKEVTVCGWVNVRRDQGKMVFFNIRDFSGVVQAVVLPDSKAIETAKEIKQESAISIKGKINERPAKNKNLKAQNGNIELEVLEIEILGVAESLPFDMSVDGFNLDITTELDHRALTLRHPRLQSIFKVQSAIIDLFREFMKAQDFFEFQAPSIVPATAEGGAEVFQLDYFDKKAYLSQSPQLYKQIVMSAFERVFSVNKVFRAEPSATTRHLTEIVSLDVEFGFINSWRDVRDLSEKTVRFILNNLKSKCEKELEFLGAVLPKMINETPTLSLKEAQDKIFIKTNRDVRGEKDLNPEDEKIICEIIKEETGSDFVYIYGYPTKQKPFYVFPNPENPEFNEGMDLLCKGVEWLSGGRRINDYTQLMRHVEEWGMDSSKIEMFLEAFKYGVPPEGGFAFGAERMTMQILGLKNIREASMFPRDMHRIDQRLSQ